MSFLEAPRENIDYANYWKANGSSLKFLNVFRVADEWYRATVLSIGEGECSVVLETLLRRRGLS